ncbi:MAG: phosphotransferase, partial [Muribaculaceae bacterium]|nr:phosphotransferase [Muribaculaceae bacterium]
TGRDIEVINFLEERGEVTDFLHHAKVLVFPVIERYKSRGFTSLQIGFGCTGGQHRSVYCAQQMAEAIARRFKNIRVMLLHREQGIRELLNF